MRADRGATCCCWPRQIQVYSHSCMDFNEMALKRPLIATSTLGGAPGLKASTSGEIGLECASKLVHLRNLKCECFFFLFFHGLFSCLRVGPMICSVRTAATSFTGLGMALVRVIFCPSLTPHRFSAFWLRSKCSICSYQLNIWYEDHVSSSILNGFLQGMERQELAPVPWRVGLALQYRKDRLTPLTTQSLANQHQMVVSTHIRQRARLILAICHDQVSICHHFYMRQF